MENEKSIVITSNNQTGGQTAHTIINQNFETPPPIISTKLKRENFKQQNSYLTELDLLIVTKIPLGTLQIIVTGNYLNDISVTGANGLQFNVYKEVSRIQMIYSFSNVVRGHYLLSVITDRPDKLHFDIRYE